MNNEYEMIIEWPKLFNLCFEKSAYIFNRLFDNKYLNIFKYTQFTSIEIETYEYGSILGKYVLVFQSNWFKLKSVLKQKEIDKITG